MRQRYAVRFQITRGHKVKIGSQLGLNATLTADREAQEMAKMIIPPSENVRGFLALAQHIKLALLQAEPEPEFERRQRG